jgi:hypothetical protein
MPPVGRDTGQDPLFGPGGRIPAVQAVTLTRPSGIAVLRAGWLTRHTLAMAVLTPVIFTGYAAALGTGLGDPAWDVLLGAMSLVAAMILTTYLPLRGQGRATAASCSLMAGLLVPGAGVLLSQGAGIAGGAMALAILLLGLLQRVSGTSACG